VILLHQSVPLLNHALACRFVHCTGIKIRLAKGYVGLALLKQRGVVHDSSAIGTQAISGGLLVTQPKSPLSVAIRPRAKVWRRRLFMR
jgi:hypothetical protein